MNIFTLCSSAIGVAGSIGGLCAVTQNKPHLMNKASFVRSRYMFSENPNNRPCISMIPGLKIYSGNDFDIEHTKKDTEFFKEKSEELGKGCVSINWFKQELDNGVIMWDMQLTWSLMKGREGIVVLEKMYYSDEEDDIYSSHEIFGINKKGSGDWSVSNYKHFAWLWDVHDNDKFKKEELLPQISKFNIHSNLDEYWGVGEDDIEKMKGRAYFNLETLKSAKGLSALLMWEEDKDNAKNGFSDWSKNLDDRLKASTNEQIQKLDFEEWKGVWSIRDFRYEDVTNEMVGYYGEWSQRWSRT